MYFQKGMLEVLSIVQKATQTSTKNNSFDDKQLKNNYKNFLLKESIFEKFDFNESLKIMDFKNFQTVAPNFCGEKANYFSINSKLLAQRISNGFFTKGMEVLKLQCKEIYELATLLIKIILVNHLSSYMNGTTKNTIGLASLDFKDNYLQQDFIELIVHQLSHMIIYLDDYTEPHMSKNNKTVMIDTGLRYKLGGTQFPSYLAFHSYLVGIEVLCFREIATGLHFESVYHGKTSRIIKCCQEFEKSLLNSIFLFTEKGQAILEKSFGMMSRIAKNFNKS